MSKPKKPRGYSYATVKAVLAGDPAHVGVRLGRVCIENDVPIAQVAQDVGVSRLTVYTWFHGEYMPRAELVPKIRELIAKYAMKQV